MYSHFVKYTGTQVRYTTILTLQLTSDSGIQNPRSQSCHEILENNKCRTKLLQRMKTTRLHFFPYFLSFISYEGQVGRNPLARVSDGDWQRSTERFNLARILDEQLLHSSHISVSCDFRIHLVHIPQFIHVPVNYISIFHHCFSKIGPK